MIIPHWMIISISASEVRLNMLQSRASEAHAMPFMVEPSHRDPLKVEIFSYMTRCSSYVISNIPADDPPTHAPGHPTDLDWIDFLYITYHRPS